MRRQTHWLNGNVFTHRVVLTAMLAIVMPFTILACSPQPEISSTATDKEPDAATFSTGAGAMKAYKDPETGKLGPPPDGVSVRASSKAVQDATSTSSEGLVEKPAPGGGTMVDLKGRFQSIEGAPKADEKAPKPAGKQNNASHLKAYIDPETGRFGVPPDAASIPDFSETVERLYNTSMEGLVEVPAPGGGTMVDLKGRFSSPLIGTKDKSGKITTSHATLPKHN